MKQILSIVILSFVLSCSQGNSDKELQQLKEENKQLSEQLQQKEKATKQAARKKKLAADKADVRATLEGLISAIENSDFDHLQTLCCNECDTDTEVLNICNLGSMRLGDRIGVKQMFKNANLLNVTVDGTTATGTIYFPRTKHKGTVELEKHGGRWLMTSM